ncbi:MAG: hypothetical protein NTZ26_05210 [Candidatus Aminicenantes bacterium]|nr:hypothetical protein [Candidatus Aminicenantes bacterium]
MKHKSTAGVPGIIAAFSTIVGPFVLIALLNPATSECQQSALVPGAVIKALEAGAYLSEWRTLPEEEWAKPTDSNTVALSLKDFHELEQAMAPWSGRRHKVRIVPEPQWSTSWRCVTLDGANVRMTNLDLSNVTVGGLSGGIVSDVEVQYWEQEVKRVDESGGAAAVVSLVAAPYKFTHLNRVGTVTTTKAELRGQASVSALLVGPLQWGLLVVLDQTQRLFADADITPEKGTPGKLLSLGIKSAQLRLHVIRTEGELIELGASTRLFISVSSTEDIAARAIPGIVGTQITLEPGASLRWRGLELIAKIAAVTFVLAEDPSGTPTVESISGGELTVNKVAA